MANVIAQTYALSLFEVAEETKKEELLLTELEEVCALMQEHPQFLELLSSPMVSKAERASLVDEVFEGKIDLYLLNFLKVLSEGGRVQHLSHIEKEYRELYYLRENIQEAVATTAVPMNEEQKAKLIAKLEKSTGKKILLKNEIDTSLIGGVVLKIGNRQMDDSVKSRLEGVRRQIQGSLT